MVVNIPINRTETTGNQVRHYTYGGDLAVGIRIAIDHPQALNEDFNLSTAQQTTVLELAELIWNKIYTGEKSFRYESEPPYTHDVQMRSPDVEKAARLLDFRATTSLSQVLDEVIPWVAEQTSVGQTQNPCAK